MICRCGWHVLCQTRWSDIRTNLRYGCTILRHYSNLENGNMERALARYNGSLGSRRYPDAVIGAWQNRWQWS